MGIYARESKEASMVVYSYVLSRSDKTCYLVDVVDSLEEKSCLVCLL